MTTQTIQKSAVNTEVTKPTVKAIKLDLDKALAQVWNRGLPNDILNPA